MEFLVAEDVFLLLTDDTDGRTADGGHLVPLLGGALLVELALLGAAEVEPRRGTWHSPKVSVTDGAATDPLLARALATVAEKPRSAQSLVQLLGKGAARTVGDRLVERGVLEHREHKVLGIFPARRLPSVDDSHERDVRRRLAGVLLEDGEPDARTGALVALLSAVDRAHKVVVSPAVPPRQVRARARTIAEGQWAPTAVKQAVEAATAAMLAAVAAAAAASSAGS